MVLVLLEASDLHGVSAGRLYALAEGRSGLDPKLVRNGLSPRYGLFQFQQTQWRETQLGIGGATPQEVLARDIMDVRLQADAAAWLVVRGRLIR